jgi:diguanylate cyclase (GGDEF)-like protein
MSSAEHLEAGRAGAGAADGHVACSMTSTRLRRLRHTHGPAALDSILELAGGLRSPDELEDVGTRQLTELLGHRAFHEALAEAVDDESRDPVTLALIDIDDFKQSNDDHGGHPVGDEALKSVANALRATVRDPRPPVPHRRRGGCPPVAGPQRGEAAAVAERVRQAVSECPFRLPLHVSVGIASHPDDARDRRRLLELAEEALYSAKRAGKDQTHLATA